MALGGLGGALGSLGGAIGGAAHDVSQYAGGVLHPVEAAMHPIVRGALNVLTGGAYEHPAETAAYWRGVLSSFNPAHPAGALNLASVMVPGGAEGRPTGAQGDLLRAIRGTSYDLPAEPNLGRYQSVIRTGGESYPAFNLQDPATRALAGHIGLPAMIHTRVGPAAVNPLEALINARENAFSRLGLLRDTFGNRAGEPSRMLHEPMGAHAQLIRQALFNYLSRSANGF
jgi:hypothetical protein